MTVILTTYAVTLVLLRKNLDPFVTKFDYWNVQRSFLFLLREKAVSIKQKKKLIK